MTTVSYAELLQCDDARECSLVCYFPSSSARTDHVYRVNGVTVDRVRVEAVGDDNLLYTSQRIDRLGTMPTYHPLESFILPKDYPCRLSPVEQGKELTASGLSAPIGEPVGKETE
jgi:hypothetical protein